MTAEEYVAKIEECSNVKDLDYVIECAAYDGQITHQEYCDLYAVAVDKARRF